MDKIFTLSEANQLIPHLAEYLNAVRRAKAVLVKTKGEIQKASANASLGGGCAAGPHYIRALEEISTNLHEIQEMGIHVKDLDKGLCDFPYFMEGRIVYLCWRLGEEEIMWWHEVDVGFQGRQPLPTEHP